MTDDLNASPFGAQQGGRHWLVRLYDFCTLPLTIHFVLTSPRIHADYKLGFWRRQRLGWRMYRNTRRVWTGVSYRAHLAMAVKLFEIPPTTPGVVVECGCFRGGTSANLALMCEVVDRQLYIYDSFEGLPPATDGDQYGQAQGSGFLSAGLDQVKAHVEAHGAAGRTTYVKGWFEDTTPLHEPPIVLMFLDVDYQASLTDCILNLWPKLTPRGYCFIDEFIFNDYCALFWSERFWSTNFDRTPPGLMGSGTGISLGGYYLGGPLGMRKESDFSHPDSVAYTRKNWSGYWGFYPEEPAPEAVTASSEDSHG
jgi:O-methyltransferase